MRTTTPPVQLNVEAPGTLKAEIDVRQSRITDHSVPESFTELYDRYYGYVVRLVKRRGIAHSDVEDVAQTIFAHFYRRGSLEYFDAERVDVHDGREYTAKFTTFLSGFVVTYLQHHLTMQERNENRMVRSGGLDSLMEDPTEENSWVNTRGPRYDDDHSRVEYVEFVENLHVRLSSVKPRSARTVCDLPVFFEAIRKQIEVNGKYDADELAAQFGVARRTIHNWLGLLRAELNGL
jgi:hypothetical protein